MQRSSMRGFSLVELLLVLAILGIISGIAIPSFLGQRDRARVIGDAKANAKVLSMALEAKKAENGIYGPPNAIITWLYTPSTKTYACNDATFLPTFKPQGNSKMSYSLTINDQGVKYTLSVTDPNKANAPTYNTDETGAELPLK